MALGPLSPDSHSAQLLSPQDSDVLSQMSSEECSSHAQSSRWGARRAGNLAAAAATERERGPLPYPPQGPPSSLLHSAMRKGGKLAQASGWRRCYGPLPSTPTTWGSPSVPHHLHTATHSLGSGLPPGGGFPATLPTSPRPPGLAPSPLSPLGVCAGTGSLGFSCVCHLLQGQKVGATRNPWGSSPWGTGGGTKDGHFLRSPRNECISLPPPTHTHSPQKAGI